MLQRQPGLPSFLLRGASEPIIRKLNQAAFATADTPSGITATAYVLRRLRVRLRRDARTLD
jgi:hypothetical protein